LLRNFSGRAKIWTADRDSGLRRGLTRDRLA
jgi:hypothetical protein